MSSVNNTTNYTRILQSSNIRTRELTDGVATLTNGYLSNLNNAVNPLDVATKNDVDSFVPSTGASSILTSVQFKISTITGDNFGGSNNLTFTGGTLFVNGTLTNNMISMVPSITGGKIYNLDDPTDPQDAATKNYVENDNINSVSFSTTSASNNLTTDQVVNKILNRTTTVLSTVQDILPNSATIIASMTSQTVGSSFTFVYKYSSSDPRFVTLLFNGNGLFPQGNIYNIYGQTNVVTVESNSMVVFTGVIMSNTSGSELVNFYINNLQGSVNSPAQITPSGLVTPIFNSGQIYSTFNNSLLLYPVVKTSITSQNYTYSSADVKNLLITRNLTADSTDTFEIASTFLGNSAFSLGSGTFKFYIQNISSYTITVDASSPVGWSQSPASITIGPESCSGFYVYANTGSTTCKLFEISSGLLDGI
jgi:hypothetical protein